MSNKGGQRDGAGRKYARMELRTGDKVVIWPISPFGNGVAATAEIDPETGNLTLNYEDGTEIEIVKVKK